MRVVAYVRRRVIQGVARRADAVPTAWMRSATGAVVMACAACTDAATAPPTSRRSDALPVQQRSAIEVLAADTANFPIERGFRAISRVAPGFAGYHFDEDGQLIVRLVDTTQLAAVAPLVRAQVAPVAVDASRGRFGRSARLV